MEFAQSTSMRPWTMRESYGTDTAIPIDWPDNLDIRELATRLRSSGSGFSAACVQERFAWNHECAAGRRPLQEALQGVGAAGAGVCRWEGSGPEIPSGPRRLRQTPDARTPARLGLGERLRRFFAFRSRSTTPPGDDSATGTRANFDPNDPEDDILGLITNARETVVSIVENADKARRPTGNPLEAIFFPEPPR
jgi:hypothetical protein